MIYVMYLISYLLIIVTFFNDGFTGMFFSFLPIIFLAGDSFNSRKYNKLIINSILIIVLFILSITRFSNPLIYPILNESLTTTKDYNLVNYKHNIQELVELEDQKSSMESFIEGSFEEYKKSYLFQEYLLKKDTLVKPIKVSISGHPDILGISYDLLIDINDTKVKGEVNKYIASHYPNLVNSNNNIYAGDWFFENFPKKNIYRHIVVENIFEKNLCQAVMIFHPFLIWIYLIILYFQIRYLEKSS